MCWCSKEFISTGCCLLEIHTYHTVRSAKQKIPEYKDLEMYEFRSKTGFWSIFDSWVPQILNIRFFESIWVCFWRSDFVEKQKRHNSHLWFLDFSWILALWFLKLLESIAPKNSQDRSAWGGPSPSKQNFAWTVNAYIWQFNVGRTV